MYQGVRHAPIVKQPSKPLTAAQKRKALVTARAQTAAAK